MELVFGLFSHLLGTHMGRAAKSWRKMAVLELLECSSRQTDVLQRVSLAYHKGLRICSGKASVIFQELQPATKYSESESTCLSGLADECDFSIS